MILIAKILPYAQIILSVILVSAILLQQSAAGLGGALGGNDNDSFHHTRRGFEKFLFYFNPFIFTNITSSPFTLTVPMITRATTTYRITEVTDFYGTYTTPSLPAIQVVNQKPVNSRIYQYEPVVKK